jgi:hypothetical protein
MRLFSLRHVTQAGDAIIYRMPTDHDNRVQPADPSLANDYDSFAEAYTAESDAGIINVY